VSPIPPAQQTGHPFFAKLFTHAPSSPSPGRQQPPRSAPLLRLGVIAHPPPPFSLGRIVAVAVMDGEGVAVAVEVLVAVGVGVIVGLRLAVSVAVGVGDSGAT